MFVCFIKELSNSLGNQTEKGGARASTGPSHFVWDNSRQSLPKLTWMVISDLEATNATLRRVADFTNVLSAENYLTVSFLVFMIHHLRKTLSNWRQMMLKGHRQKWTDM